MISHCQGQVRPAHLTARVPQTLKGLRAGDLMNQMAVDIEQARAVLELPAEPVPITLQQIQQAFRRTALRVHPDKQAVHGLTLEASTVRMQEASAAAEVLKLYCHS